MGARELGGAIAPPKKRIAPLLHPRDMLNHNQRFFFPVFDVIWSSLANFIHGAFE